MAVKESIRQNLPSARRATTVEELVKLYYQFQAKEGRSKATLDWHGLSLGKFVDFLEPGSPVSDLADQETIDLFIDYLADEDQALKPVSINTSGR
jgi:hypothetical protein